MLLSGRENTLLKNSFSSFIVVCFQLASTQLSKYLPPKKTMPPSMTPSPLPPRLLTSTTSIPSLVGHYQLFSSPSVSMPRKYAQSPSPPPSSPSSLQTHSLSDHGLPTTDASSFKSSSSQFGLVVGGFESFGRAQRGPASVESVTHPRSGRHLPGKNARSA